MHKGLVKLWDAHKEKVFAKLFGADNSQRFCQSYENLVSIVLVTLLEQDGLSLISEDVEYHGDYQGTMHYMLDFGRLLVTGDASYGSCEACDGYLEAVSIPDLTEHQEVLRSMALHVVQWSEVEEVASP